MHWKDSIEYENGRPSILKKNPVRISFSCLSLLFLFSISASSLTAQSIDSANVTFSPETGFYVESADGFMGFRISTRLQQQAGVIAPLRYGDAVQPDFNLRRARARIHGFFYEKKLTYFLQIQMDRGRFVLSNAEFRWKATDNLQLNFGQLWPVAGRQFRTVSEVLQMVDRSPVSCFFWPNYDIGVTAQYNMLLGKEAMIKSYLSLTHGEGMNKPTAEGGMAYTGRLEVLPLGDFTKGGDYVESDIYREESPKISLGAAYYYNQDAYAVIGGTPAPNFWENRDNDIAAFYLDGVFKYNGFSVLTEYANRTVDNEIISYTADQYYVESYSQLAGGNGFSIQSGKFITAKTEPTIRFSYLNPNEELRAAKNQFIQQNTYSLGLNHFLRGHKIKIQFELNLVNEEYQAEDGKTYLRVLSQFSVSF